MYCWWSNVFGCIIVGASGSRVVSVGVVWQESGVKKWEKWIWCFAFSECVCVFIPGLFWMIGADKEWKTGLTRWLLAVFTVAVLVSKKVESLCRPSVHHLRCQYTFSHFKVSHSPPGVRAMYRRCLRCGPTGELSDFPHMTPNEVCSRDTLSISYLTCTVPYL
jgi:hypothetical protein